MELQKGRRRTFDIEYVVVTEGNIKEVAEWCSGTVGGEGKDGYIKLVDKNAINTRQTKAFVGDLVVRSLDTRSYKSFSKKAFDKSFQTLEVRKIARDSKTGQTVTLEHAEANPDTTEVETVEVAKN